MRTTLLIDGNWLLMSRLFATKDYFAMENDEQEKHRGTYELNDLMARSINIVINRFEGIVDNIILCKDGGSWRKKVEKPECFEEEYKGTREKSVELDWSYIYKSLDDMVDAAKNNGITTTHLFGAEGDDCIWWWTKQLNEQGINTIIWSSDNDLKQLVQVKNLAFTAWYNDKNGLWLHKDLEEKPIDDIEFFMQQDVTNTSLDALRAKCNEVNYLDPEDIIESKIICGDAGDNIKSIIRVTKGTKTYKISEKDWNTVKEGLHIDTLQKFFDKKDDIIYKLMTLKKFAGYNLNKDSLSDMFDYNTKLVWLNEQTIPSDIKESFEKIEYKNCDLPYIRGNYKMLVLEDLSNPEEDIESIFKNSIPDLPF